MLNTLETRKIVTALIVVAMIFGALFAFTTVKANALTEAQIQSILSLLSSFGAEQATIDNVDASLRGQATSGTGSTGTTDCSFTRSLTIGATGDDVTCLQTYLEGTGHFTYTGAKGYFGPITQSAVAAWQAANGVTPAVGYFGPISQAKYDEVAPKGDDTTTGGDDTTTTPAPAGTGLSVVAASQPAATLAPDSATRVPFTKFTVTAGTDGAVTMNSVTVERVGLASNSVFSGVTIIDEDGTQYGLAKTLNSNNQARIGSDVTIPAGTSKTFTITGNMASDNSTRDGQVVGLNLVAVNTSATVSGSLPITGTKHTVNSSLSIGTVTAERGALDPNTANTKEVGTTNYTFAAVKLTAGSAENVRFNGIRFNQSGSASASDIENVMIYVDGVGYPTTVSADGDYYSANFSGGILIEEGLTKEVSIKGDIVSGSDRTVVMDIYQASDVNVVGETFNYGITPTATTDTEATTTSTFATDGTPWFDNAHTTIGTGSLVISSTNDVAAGNIAEGGSNVSLGSFKFDVQGEEVSFTQIVLNIATTSGSGTDGGELITNVTLVDGNGTVLAGPQDPSTIGTTVTLSDTVTLGAGEHTIIVKGTLNNNWENDDTIVVSFNPNDDITSLKGGTSGQSLTATPNAEVTAKTQTISAASLTVTPDSSLVAKNVINNSNDVVVGRYVLDATASGEDLRITTMQFEAVTGADADVDDYNSIRVFDGSTQLNTGSNVLNPSGHTEAADATITITLDSPGLTVAKGTSKVIELKANINDATVGSTPEMTFDFADGTLTSDWTVTGLTTGTTVSETLTDSAGATLTVVASGTLTASVATADPVEKWYVAGDEGTVGVFKFTGTNEPQAITDLSLRLDTGSSSSADLTEVSLWDGATKLLSSVSPFVSSNTQAFDLPTSGTGSFIVPKNESKDLTVKAKFASIGTGLAGNSGKFIKLATTTTATDNKALGTQSGTSANILGSAGTTTGAKYFRSLPTVAKQSLASTKLGNGTKELYRFSVTADDAGDIAIFKFSFTYATTSADTASWAVTEVETGKVVRSSIANSGDTGAGLVEATVNSSSYGADFITIPAGQTYTYKLTATVTNAATSGDSIQVYLNGDENAALLASGKHMDDTTAVDGQTEDDFIWSPISSGTTALATEDWINGYKVPGIEYDNLGTEVVSY